MSNDLFRIRKNRLATCFDGYGFVSVAEPTDDKPHFLTKLPLYVGDEAVIRVEGKVRKVRLLPDWHGFTYLVDQGPA